MVSTRCFLPLWFLVLFIVPFGSRSQPLNLDPAYWAPLLNVKHPKGENDYYRLFEQVDGFFGEQPDSVQIFTFLDQLSRQVDRPTEQFRARFNCLKAGFLYRTGKGDDQLRVHAEVSRLLEEAKDIAYRTEDEHLVAFVSIVYGTLIYQFGDMGLSVMYSMNAIELYEKLRVPANPFRYQFLGELLYRVRHYDASISMARKGVAAWRQSDRKDRIPGLVSCMNTVALGFHRQGMTDSALLFYQEAWQLANENKDSLWAGIVAGNMAQIFYTQGRYDTAYSLFISDYQKSRARGFYDNAANSLQWAARTNLARGRADEALNQVREAYRLLQRWPDGNYLRNIYFTFTQIFRKQQVFDSAFHYASLYSTLNDSLEKVINTSSVSISRARLSDMLSKYNIEKLNRERHYQVTLRNFLIGGIILLAIIAILVVNRLRLRTKMRMEKAEQEKRFLEQEVQTARDQLDMFTENIREKTRLIESLESQVRNRETDAERQALIAELSNQTILTEDEWRRFRSMFEKIHPGFFIKLKERSPDITLAEQRMAALIYMQLTSRQMASMLGISVDSVHKTRQRLRQRLGISADTGLEDYVAGL